MPAVQASDLEGCPGSLQEILEAVQASAFVTDRKEDLPLANSLPSTQIHFTDPPYRQHFDGYEPNITVLDLICNYGPEASGYLPVLSESELILIRPRNCMWVYEFGGNWGYIHSHTPKQFNALSFYERVLNPHLFDTRQSKLPSSRQNPIHPTNNIPQPLRIPSWDLGSSPSCVPNVS